MKAVLISIQPKWCELIASGKKTIEVRNTLPKIDVPFKVYIYEKKARFVKSIKGAHTKYGYGRGKIIGSFVCDKITCCQAYYGESGEKHLTNLFGDEVKRTCLTEHEMFDYIVGKGKKEGTGWLWHITEPKLFDKPRMLGEFRTPFPFSKHCLNCEINENRTIKGFNTEYCLACGYFKDNLTRPPQSYYFVETDENEEEKNE